MLKKLKNNRTAILIGTLFLLTGLLITKVTKTNDLHNASVMIVNRSMNSGGTGIIYRSSNQKSLVLTNDHVCKVVKNGGLVITTQGNYQVNSILESKESDLCLIAVSGDLRINTRISGSAPNLYDTTLVSGHPALMPNIISRGHLSGRAIISVMTGVQPCTEEDAAGDEALLCAFLGGIPIVKNYESILVSSTIMPGSSGSGVYNGDKNLIGVVFAGSGDFGYGWTVPYEQLKHFLEVESAGLQETLIDQKVIFKKETAPNNIREMINKCSKNTDNDPRITQICEIISKDLIWRK